MQRRERLERRELLAHRVVDHYRLAKARAAVHDPVRDRPTSRGVQRLERVATPPVDDVQLQARGAGVDDEDVSHGQVQPRTSGWSSPCSRVHARAAKAAVEHLLAEPGRAFGEAGHAVDHVDTRW